MTDMTMEFARQMVTIAKAELDRMKPEWERFTQMRAIGEGWLREHSESVEVVPNSQEPVGTFTEAVRLVLVEANGQPLHWKTILERVRRTGAQSQAKHIYSVLNTACRRAHAVSVGEGYWQLPVRQEKFVENGALPE